MKRKLLKKIVSIVICISVILSLISMPASAIAFPAFGVVSHSSGAGVYTQPGYILNGHDGRLDKTKPSDKLTTLATDTKIKLFATVADGDGDMWYEIGYGVNYQNKGYVICGRVKVIANYEHDQEFEAWLTEQGFPESYKDGLRNMHSLYPNWKFYADHTNLDFNAVVKAENGGVENVNKYIHVNSDISWKVYEKDEYNWETGNWTGYDGDSWIKTTDQVVAYYIDPRNFLDIKNVFMFVTEAFDATREDLSFVQNTVKNTFMDAALPDDTEKTYAEAILEAAKQSGVSSATIVAVICQEQGSNGTGKCISGVYSTDAYPEELKGFYNFFNIGAYAHSGRNAIENGLIWAKGGTNSSTTYNRPWNTREKAIIGGATWYGENYINVGQNTIYYKNFNVYQNTKHDVYTHQYATNIEDCVGKGSIMAAAMDSMTDNELIFHIPVYKNMPEKTDLPVKGTNNNRFLESLIVEGYELSTSFDRYTYSYETIVPYKADKVKIIADASADDAKVTGAGEVNLAVGNNDFKITVTSSSGLTATYNLSVYREKAPDGEAPMPELNTKYKIGDYITNIQPETTVAAFKTNLGVTNGKPVVMNSLGNEKKDGLIATGDTVHLYDTNEKIRATYRVVIYGDIDGNGKITSVDLLAGQNHIIGKELLANIYVTAMDIDNNGKVNSIDLLAGQDHVIGKKSIQQQR